MPRVISIWWDTHSGPDYPPAWVVSLDDLDDDGDTQESTTLSTHGDDLDAAQAAAQRAAGRHGWLRVVQTDKAGR